MQVLDTQQAALVYGGDNPSMGPYAPPFDAGTQAAFMSAMAPLLGTLPGYISEWVQTQMQQDMAARASVHNTNNGYNAAGTRYQWPSGVWAPVHTSGSVQSAVGSQMAAYAEGQFIQMPTEPDPLREIDFVLEVSFDSVSAEGAGGSGGWGHWAETEHYNDAYAAELP